MRNLLIGLLVVGCAFVVIACLHKHHSGPGKCEWMKDAKIEVTDIEDGVVVKLTSEKPEAINRLQGHLPINVELAAIENGIVVKVTSDKPEVVKKVQERARDCQERHKIGKCKYGR